MEKEKEKIRAQIIKSLEAYKGKIGIDFFNFSNSAFNQQLPILDDNDLEVVLLTFDDSNWILITTKCLFVSRDSIVERIEGKEIEAFNFKNVKNGRTKERALEFDDAVDFKKWLYSGDFEIVKKDRSTSVVNLPNHDFGFCLFNGIKKLKFVSNKYEVI